MAAPYSLTQVNTILPQLFNDGIKAYEHDYAFLNDLEKAQKSRRINNKGVITPMLTVENNAAFGMGENTSIQQGTPNEYITTSVGLRNIWISFFITGMVMRTMKDYILQIKRNSPAMMDGEVKRLATNYAMRDLVASTLENLHNWRAFFACQGSAKSEIAVITGLPGGNNVTFAWGTTKQGNRVLTKNLSVQFHAPGGAQRVAGYAAGTTSSTIDIEPDKSGALAATAAAHFDALPTNLAIGDTVHLVNGFATNPQGYLSYVDDTGDVNGTQRSLFARGLSSVVVRGAAANISPLHLRKAASQIEGKVGYNQKVESRIYLGKALFYEWGNHIYNQGGYLTAFNRQIDGTKRTESYDPSINNEGIMWEGKRIKKEKHIPPGDFFMPNFATWEIKQQTPCGLYEYDDGQILKNVNDATGLFKDQKQGTIFCEENFNCRLPAANARGEGFTFDATMVELP